MQGSRWNDQVADGTDKTAAALGALSLSLSLSLRGLSEHPPLPFLAGVSFPHPPSTYFQDWTSTNYSLRDLLCCGSMPASVDLFWLLCRGF